MKKWVIVLVLLAAVKAASEQDTVLQLLSDLKNGVALELEALDEAWERHRSNQQSVLDALAASAQEQRAECAKKDADVESKKRDISITQDYINWMFKRQSLNNQRIGVLEASMCQQNNNYVHDIKNYKIAIALVQFLRAQLDKFGPEATLIQKQSFIQQVQKFLRLYHTGRLLTMVETLQKDDGSFYLPDLEGLEEADIAETVLTNTRGHARKGFSFLQKEEESADKADSAVVLIPGCDNSINTVVVVQNDDGSGSGSDLNVTVKDGKIEKTEHKNPDEGKPKKPVIPVDVESEEEGDGESAEESEEENEGESQSESVLVPGLDDGEESSEGGEEWESEGEESEGGESEDGGDAGDDGSKKTGEETGGDGDKKPDGGKGEEDEDFPNTLDGLRKLLDAIEKRSKAALEKGAENEVRAAGNYIDFKIHIELENGTFDKHILLEKDNLIKLNNQLTTRVNLSRQCNARLKQLDIAHQVYIEDFQQSFKNYEELRKQKEDELATFEDVHRIYVNQVA